MYTFTLVIEKEDKLFLAKQYTRCSMKTINNQINPLVNECSNFDAINKPFFVLRDRSSV